jgi:hypothetical protein
MSDATVSSSLPHHNTPDVAESHEIKNRRSFFGFGKKKRDSVEKEQENTQGLIISKDLKIVCDIAPQLPELARVSPLPHTPPSISTPRRISTPPPPPRPLGLPNSPVQSLDVASRSATASYASTPSIARLSTSGSQIFERNVQEHPNNHNIPAPTSPSIPAHIQTENHIPPALEASLLAITDRDCDVDEVEIVTHSAHQPAAAVVAVPGPGSPIEPGVLRKRTANSEDYICDDLSSYGSGSAAMAATDKHRLSFISFADVVQAEQQEQLLGHHIGDTSHRTSPKSRGSPVQSAVVDSIAISTINETLRRSPSPIRPGSASPLSGGFLSSDLNPVGNQTRSIDGNGELTIETMRQTLRKSGSGDFGGYSWGSGVGMTVLEEKAASGEIA